jgi:SAM-dependent methyltransferase
MLCRRHDGKPRGALYWRGKDADMDTDAQRLQTKAAYESPGAVAFFAGRVDQGLRPYEAAVVRRFLAAPGRVLVVGAGGGRELFALETLGFEVAGVDISEPLVAAARAEAARRGSRADIRLTDGAALPFADARFDAVTLWSQVLGFVAGAAARAAFLAEVRRVLRPGGSLSFTAHDTPRTLARVVPERVIARDDPEPGDVTIDSPEEGAVWTMHYFDEREVRALAAAAGFRLRLLTHSDDLGADWDNLFVVEAEAV